MKVLLVLQQWNDRAGRAHPKTEEFLTSGYFGPGQVFEAMIDIRTPEQLMELKESMLRGYMPVMLVKRPEDVK